MLAGGGGDVDQRAVNKRLGAAVAGNKFKIVADDGPLEVVVLAILVFQQRPHVGVCRHRLKRKDALQEEPIQE